MPTKQLIDCGDTIKTAYEDQDDTNAFTDAEKAKLEGIEQGAQVNVPVTKEDVGLENVDNTSDADKPLSDAAVAAISLLLPSATVNNREATLGDSITFYEANVDANQISMPARGDMSWYLFFSRFVTSFKFGRDESNNLTGSCYGYSGERTADIIARLPAVIASMKADGIGRCFVHIGTNDLSSANANAETIKANLLTIWSAISDAGIEVIAETIAPRTYAGSGLTTSEIAANKKKQHAVNRFIREIGKSGLVPLLNKVADPEDFLVDPTSAAGDLLTSTSTDGLHPNDLGGYYRGLARYRVMAPFLPLPPPNVRSQNDLYDATLNPTGCLNANPLMTGASGSNGTGSSGDVATGYASLRGSGSTITAVNSKGATALDGSPGAHQVIGITSSGSGASGELWYLHQAITSNFSAGDVIEVFWPVEVTATADILENFRLEVRFEGGGTGTHYARHLVNAAGRLPFNVVHDGLLGTQEYVVPEGTTTIRVRLVCQVTGSVAGVATLKAGECAVRKVIT